MRREREGSPLGEAEREKKIQVETKRRNHIKKHLKENGRRLRRAERRPEKAEFSRRRG